MSSMATEQERYNGYANRETWAFNLHWQNDQGLYNETLEQAGQYLTETYGLDWRELPEDEKRGAFYGVGENVVIYWQNAIESALSDFEDGTYSPDRGSLRTLRMMEREVGSWWRIDYAEVGAAVRESLDAEGL